VREGGPELLLGVLGPKSLRRVGKYADGALTWSFATDPVEVRGMFDVVEDSWRENGRTGSPRLLCGCYFSLGESAHDDLASWFDARRRDGRVRECHGDLHCRNVVRIGAELTPFDAIDFAPHLRWIDVASDAAFLAMDDRWSDKYWGYGFRMFAYGLDSALFQRALAGGLSHLKSLPGKRA
jgi:alkanesulfonate monooxygenase SsuD/methylene tetrahydromethanopterin reductase-like flavin-dependent oxidoreductase (luciferase family)